MNKFMCLKDSNNVCYLINTHCDVTIITGQLLLFAFTLNALLIYELFKIKYLKQNYYILKKPTNVQDVKSMIEYLINYQDS